MRFEFDFDTEHSIIMVEYEGFVGPGQAEVEIDKLYYRITEFDHWIEIPMEVVGQSILDEIEEKAYEHLLENFEGRLCDDAYDLSREG